MKKMSLITFTTLTFCALPTFAKTQTQTEKQDYFSNFWISGTIFNRNDQFTSFSNLKAGYKTQISYNFTENFYMNADVIWGIDSEWGYGFTAGAQYQVNKFTPYLEMSWNSLGQKNHKALNTIDYDIGSYYELPFKIKGKMQAFLELDDFMKNTNFMTGGIKYFPTGRIAITTKLAYNYNLKRSQGAVTLAYAL